ncbi:IQCJ-SCHIP1 readthrough transcript protein-like isoform X2 [Ostrea edulis]|nr:IQCJ-SCHIP1 readthrough transcript protein-like isoform X2 [Ostrea edulis]
MFSQDFHKPNSQTEKAAITIQKYIRGYLGRKKYVELLCDKFEKEEFVLQLKVQQQVEEGELLVENHRLEVLLDDNITRRRNKSRHYIMDVVTIQRAWRSYLRNKVKVQEEDDTKKDNSTEKTVQHPAETDQETPTTVAETDQETPTTVAETDQETPTTVAETDQEMSTTVEESDSVSSSYSEVSVTESSLRELTGNGNPENNQTIEHYAGESVEDFNKRLRKVNLLSLAQEFAELQKVNSDFVEPEDKTEEVSSDNKDICDRKPANETKESKNENQPNTNVESGSVKTDDFEVYNIETALPSLDWDDLELKLQQATENSSKLTQRNDREAIRQKLAMDNGMDDSCSSQRSYKKPLVTKSANTKLQICFMNEEQEMAGPPSQQNVSMGNYSQQEGQSGRTADEEQEKDGEFLIKQAKLQQEAKIALVQAGTMAHMQLEVEKQIKKKSPIANVVKMPFLENLQHRVGNQDLCLLNLGQLQVLVNDLHTQIENLNEELMNLLMERDELHMSQDSMLVDIEDLTRRVEEAGKRQ